MKKENKTVLFISHDLEELMEVCSKLIVLRDGVFVVLYCKPDERLQ